MTADTPPLTNARETAMLAAVRQGDADAASQLLPLVYDELRSLAGRMLRREFPGHTLQPTAIVHEAYLRLIDQTRTDWQDRTHFCSIAAEAIRRVLVDHARKRNAIKRGGRSPHGERPERLTLSGVEVSPAVSQVDLLALDDALGQLERMHERQAKVVKLRFFAGLTNEEIACVLGVSRSTVADDWTAARAWLLSRLSEGSA
jgi:RNA polymerase sigma-70 factor (ECF subfamily)